MSISSRPRVRLTVQPSFLHLLLALCALGSVIGYVATESWSPAYGLGVGLIYLPCLAIHEGGHGLAAVMTGRDAVQVTLAAKPHVTIRPERATGWARVFISAAGPLPEAVTGLLLVAASPSGSPAWWAGTIGVAAGLVGLLIPTGPDSDGWKFWCGILQAAGRLP